MHQYQGHIAMGRPITLTVVSPKIPKSLSQRSKLGRAADNISPAKGDNNPIHNSPGDEKSKASSNIHAQDQNNLISREPLMARDHNLTTMQQEEADMTNNLGAFAPEKKTTLPALDIEDYYHLIL
jgi:hypothetical protein